MYSDSLPKYKYYGARSLVVLHEKYLVSFLETWKEAKKFNIPLPKTDDKDYESLETLLQHVLGASGRYIKWICEKLELPNPNIKEVPKLENIESEVQEYVNYLVNSWRTPLKDVEEKKFHNPSFKSYWGSEFCIDAMLEHAVMHPIRHLFQLQNLIEEQKTFGEK